MHGENTTGRGFSSTESVVRRKLETATDVEVHTLSANSCMPPNFATQVILHSLLQLQKFQNCNIFEYSMLSLVVCCFVVVALMMKEM